MEDEVPAAWGIAGHCAIVAYYAAWEGKPGSLDGEETWTLLRDGQVIADLVVTGQDWPWLHAHVERQPGFTNVEPLFTEELRLLDRLGDQLEEWEDAYLRARAVVSLAAPDGTIVPEFLLHIDGEHAWWRWADDPFS